MIYMNTRLSYHKKYKKYKSKSKYKYIITQKAGDLPLGMVKNPFGIHDLEGRWQEGTCSYRGPAYYITDNPNTINTKEKCKEQENLLERSYNLVHNRNNLNNSEQYTDELIKQLEKYLNYNFGKNKLPKCAFDKKNKRCYNKKKIS